ncbi:hypothetical protein QJS04_geneDACA006184 [Acorus gramineus]|uniref:Myb-like domain-containing protein n=1 Tax=Acorus gramineus TaxID=55184 RepID=A0AAV9B1H0_ACOGR|nr:hypothetical protein QJS04_geneDACA006184 [Acorus gramineus]
MAASASPSGNPEGSRQRAAAGGAAATGGGGGGGGTNSGGPAVTADVAAVEKALKNSTGVVVHWTAEEQSILDEGLVKHGSVLPLALRYSKIALNLSRMTARDVALRVKWMSTRKDSHKRRKDDQNLSKKSKDKKERAVDPSAKSTHLGARQNVPPYALPVPIVDNDDEISNKEIGGPIGQLFEQNTQAFNQISANLTSLQISTSPAKIQENINLLCQARDNILSILNDMNDAPEIMKQMPPLPEKLNEELANSILPRSNMPPPRP